MKKTKTLCGHTALRRALFPLMLLLLMLAMSITAFAWEPKPTKIKAVKKTVTVSVGHTVELKVRTTPRHAEDDYLKWTIIKGKKYVRFEDRNRYDDDMEFHAVKAGTATVRCQIVGTKKKVDFKIKVKKASPSTKKIKAVGPAARTVVVGSSFELEVRKYKGLSDKRLKWTIADPSILGFEDNDYDDLHDEEIELVAYNPGTTTVTCENTLTGQKVTFTITVK